MKTLQPNNHSIETNRSIGVLILDDNPADIVTIERMLVDSKEGAYKTYCFNAMQQSIDFLTSNHDRIDVCLVDYAMGLNTAFDFIDLCRKSYIRSIPIVVMTGQIKESIDIQLMNEGVQDYWCKADLNAEMLERCIRFSMHRHNNYLIKDRESLNKTNHLAHVSHELKNPLTAIIGFSKVAERLWQAASTSDEIERIEDCFAGITRNTEQLKRLIDELLDLTAMSTGQFQINREQCCLQEILSEIQHDYASLAARDGLTLEISNTVSYDIFADKRRITQVISNLVSNAIKYTEAGKVSVNAQSSAAGGESQYITINVEDTGIGIDQDKHACVFTKYAQTHAHNTLSKKVESTGLGLAITKQLVELHGGTIKFASTLGKGSKFTVMLPQRKAR